MALRLRCAECGATTRLPDSRVRPQELLPPVRRPPPGRTGRPRRGPRPGPGAWAASRLWVPRAGGRGRRLALRQAAGGCTGCGRRSGAAPPEPPPAGPAGPRAPRGPGRRPRNSIRCRRRCSTRRARGRPARPSRRRPDFRPPGPRGPRPPEPVVRELKLPPAAAAGGHPARPDHRPDGRGPARAPRSGPPSAGPGGSSSFTSPRPGRSASSTPTWRSCAPVHQPAGGQGPLRRGMDKLAVLLPGAGVVRRYDLLTGKLEAVEAVRREGRDGLRPGPLVGRPAGRPRGGRDPAVRPRHARRDPAAGDPANNQFGGPGAAAGRRCRSTVGRSGPGATAGCSATPATGECPTGSGWSAWRAARSPYAASTPAPGSSSRARTASTCSPAATSR